MKHPFYTPDDHPSSWEADAIWKQVQPTLPVGGSRPSNILIHWRSFVLGNAAAILVALSGIGVWSVLNSPMLDRSAKVDAAYEAAMNTLAGISSELIQAAPADRRAQLETTVMNIEDIDRVIAEIRDDMLINGTSALKQVQLRQMYAVKMDYMKDLLLAGEVEL